ncbi:MAG: hypothetical protein ACUVXJ_06585 [Phycisphaerae bacterium]
MVKRISSLCCHAHVLVTVLVAGVSCVSANGAVALLGVQYQEDDPFTEYLCFWHDRDYPTSCGVDLPGANLHVLSRMREARR